MKEKIFSLTLDIKNPDAPFAIQRSISVESGDLTKVLSEFPLKLHQLLKEIHKEEIDELRKDNYDDDIPF